MDLRLLTLCLAASLAAVCLGCSTGKEFITSFLPNDQGRRGRGHKLHVVLTAQGSQAKVHIQVASMKLSKRLTLSAGETKWVSLPSQCELHKEFVNLDSVVKISSSAEIAVVSFNRRHATGDGAVILPTEELGTDYVVFTPVGAYKHMDSLVAIVNSDSPNQITIHPGSDVSLRGGSQWERGKAVIVILEPYSTYLIRGLTALTGTRIQSQRPVAVLGGHQCLSLGVRCEHVYEQMPPVSSLGKEYLVPPTISCRATSWAAIVAAEDNTKLTMQIGRTSITRKLSKAGDFTLQKLLRKKPMIVGSDKNVMVLLLSNNKPSDPFLITLTPTSNLASDWAVDTVPGIPSFITIMSEREGSASVKVCRNRRCLRSVHWKNFLSNEQWVWSVIPVGRRKSHVTVEGDSDLAVYIHGGKHRHAYGTPGTCSRGGGPEGPTDPCDKVKCGSSKEHCVNGKCVHVSKATCRVMGDPHLITFDGRRYDFQGSCTYIVATVATKSSHLPPFTVITKHNHRGSRRVSYVRIVTVSVYSQTIVIDSRRGKVQVNGELETLPVWLLDGKINIKQSGVYASLTTDFGLNVKYDWNMRLTIIVPSSYFQQLGGLCGNFNGDRKDDLPVPKGAHLSAVLKMVQKWKLKDPDLFCHDNCAGRCPLCPMRQQERFRRPNICGMLTDPHGPFATCHKTVQSTTYLDNCVYDVCVNKGARQFLCDNLKSYADACMSEGIKLNPEWRTISHCYLPCPKRSHYEACGSACPATCSDPHSQDKCEEPCVDGCQCDEGTVLSGDKCVPESSCGCQYAGRYHEADSPFWGDRTCTSRCECKNGEAKCQSVSCQKNERCGLMHGVRDCYPVSYGICQGRGDPHWETFDRKRYDFQGTCTYLLSEVAQGSAQGLEPFRVLVTNENRGRNKAVSFTKAVSITVFGNWTVSMSRSSKGQVMVNGRSVNLPYSMGDGKLSVFRHGHFGTVNTSFGLSLKFNWRSQVSLTLPSSYSGSTQGLCGNFNGNPVDDLLKPNGSHAENINAFGDSWKVGGELGCTSDCPDGKCPVCSSAMLLRYQQREACGIIRDQSGPFSHCHSKVDHTPFFEDCVFDLCAFHGQVSSLCDSLSAFTSSCQEAGAKPKSWRHKHFCPASCGANSHYELCAPPCQLTCSGLAPPQGCDDSAPCTEDCVCNEGFVLSHDKCVPIAECGCQYHGQYYQSGQMFYPGNDCSNHCVCSEGGEVKCDSMYSCTSDEVCGMKDGSPYCLPLGVASCSVRGVRVVQTFDGQEYPLLGDCLFTLVEVDEQDEGMLEAFSVFVRQQTNEHGEVLRSVELQVYNMEISMETGVVWEIQVDGERVPLPASLADGRVRVNQNGKHILVETVFDLKLSYDTVAGVFVKLPTTYHRSPHGLCGNYNGKPSDDQASKKPADIAAAWLVDRENNPCPTHCDVVSCPEQNKTKIPEAVKGCAIIREKHGPFEECHPDVSPTPYHDACVREMITDLGSADVLCRHVQNYVTACQLSAIKISEWRSPSFCPLVCDSGSHYELCASTCSSTCSYLQTQDVCPLCQEGCQCDGTLLYDGGPCVPVEQCGCVEEGQYYKSGESVLQNDCTEECTCQSGMFNCEAFSCGEHEECVYDNGTQACHVKDPCLETECREKEHCEVTEGIGTCIPDSKATCWAFGDPHYSTFDNHTYSFQGTCNYVLFRTTGAEASLPKVTVTSKNEMRDNSPGAYVRSTVVEMLDYRISIEKERGFVTVNGFKTKLPVILDEGSITITESGLRGLIQSHIGIDVTFDWSTLVMVTISSSYFGNVGGLCGNYNGLQEDDVSANIDAWAQAWSLGEDSSCSHHRGPQCSHTDRNKFSGPKYCGILSDDKGPFAGCHISKPVAEYVSDCVYDVCVSKGSHKVLCEALSSYLAQCQQAGAHVSSWRQLANCSPACPSHSHYEECGSACPPGCDPQPVFCTKQCVEGCFCDQGYVRSGDQCVLKKKACG